MFQEALEQLILLCLNPYLEGIRLGSLHKGIWNGLIELKELKVKPEVLALLGVPGFRVEKGHINLIRLVIPWSSLASGKVSLEVSGIHIEVEQMAESRSKEELIQSMREAKQQAINLRVEQVRNLLEQRRKAAEKVAGTDEGFGMKVARRFINNVTVSIKDVEVSFSSKALGIATSLKLPNLAVLSTDESFQEPVNDEVVQIADDSMFKVMRIDGFSLQLSCGDLGSLKDAKYVLSPMSTSLKLAHVPREQRVFLELDLGVGKMSEVQLTSSQVKQLLKAAAGLAEEDARLKALMVPEEIGSAALIMEDKLKAEYGLLYKRHLMFERSLVVDEMKLTPDEERRQQLLEDALPVELLAANRIAAVELAEARQEQMPGFFSQLWGRYFCCVATTKAGGVGMEELQDATEFEAVEAPANVLAEVRFSDLSVKLHDDAEEETSLLRKVLELYVYSTEFTAAVQTGVDYRGKSSANLRVAGSFGGVEAQHCGDDVIRIRTEDEERGSAAKFALENRLEETCNVLSVMLHTAPLDVNFIPSMVPKLLEMLQPPETAEPSAVAAPGDLPVEPVSPTSPVSPVSRAASMTQEAAVHALLGKEGDVAQYADAAFDRAPDQVNLDVMLAAPRIHIPVKDLGSVTVNLGSMKICTPERCSMKAVRMELAFEDTMLMVATKREEFNVISPLPIDIKLNHCETDDALTAELGLTTGDLTLVAAPQALAVLAKLPDVFAELAPAEQPAEQVQITLAEPTEQVDRSKMVSEVAEKSEAVQAATQRAKELTEKRLKVNLVARTGKLEVAVLDLIHPVLTLQSRILENGIEVKHESSMTGQNMNTSVNMNKLALVAYARNPSSHEWEPLLEPFHIGASLQLESVKEGSDALSTKLSCMAHNPLLLNVAAPSLYRLAALGPIFAASLGEGRFAEKTRYRAINLSGRPLQLHFLAPSGQSRSKELLPDGSEVSLEDEVLTYGASEITVTLKGEEASEPLSVESCHATEIPGTFCVAEMLMPEPGCRTLLLASPLRVHNTCDVPLELKVRNGQQARGTFSCNAAFLGEAPAAYAVQSNLRPRDLASKAEDTCLLMPNEILAVPEFAIEKGDALRADLLMRPFAEGHEFSTSFSLSNHLRSESYTFPVTCGREAEEGPASLPRILGSKDNGGYGYIQRKADEKVRVGAEKDEGTKAPKPKPKSICACGQSGMVTDPADEDLVEELDSVSLLSCRLQRKAAAKHLQVVRLTVRPALTLVNAVPEMDMNVGYRTPSKAMPNLLDRRPWKEVPLPSMVAVNVYELPAEAHDRGVELRTHLGTEEETPWSSVVLLRSSALENSAEMLEMDAKLSATGAAAGIVAQPLGAGRVRLSCPRLFAHRLDDLKPEEELQLLCNGAPLPKINDFTLLPTNCESKKCEVHVRRFVEGTLREMKLNVTMPVAFDTFDCKTPWGTGYYCIQTEDLAASGLLGASCKVSTLRPRLVVLNASDADLELQEPDGSILVLRAQESKPCHWHISEKSKGASSFRLRPLEGDSKVSWSAAIPCSEQAAGSTPLLLSATGSSSHVPLVWTAEIAPSFGAFSVVLKKGSIFMASNKAQKANLNMTVHPVDGPTGSLVKPGDEQPIGWTDLYTSRNFAVKVVVAGEDYHIPDVRRRTEIQIKGLKVALSVSRVGESTILALDDMYSPVAALLDSSASDDRSSTSEQASVVEVDIQLCQLGVSLVDDQPTPHELLFIHLGDIQLGYKQNITEDSEQIRFRVRELQGVCQLPERVDGSMIEHRRQHKAGVLRKELPAVILANHAEKEANFLDINITREATSSQDLVLPSADVLMDKLDVTVDFDWLSPLLSWLERAIPQDAMDSGVSWDEMKTKVGRSITWNYEPPLVPAVADVDALKLSEIDLTVWCRLPLSSLDFLPAPVRGILRVLSVSSNFTLNAASIRLPEKKLPVYRGPLENLGLCIAQDYAASLLKIVMSLLGKSSLLNAGAIPLAMGGTAVSMVTDGVGSTIRGGAGLLEHLTMDEDYHQKQKMDRQQKEISSAADGFREAGKSLATGFDGALDIFRKPVQGARQDGAKGLAIGCGTGIAGTVVKPVVGVGSAASDIITGISAAATFDSPAKKRRRERCRCRGPRMLYGQSAVMRKWSDSDSQLLLQLGAMAEGIREIIPLASSAFHRYVLLLYSDRLVVAKLRGSRASYGRHSTQVDLSGRKTSARSIEGHGHNHKLDGSFPELLQSMDDVVQRCSSDLSSVPQNPHTGLARGLLFEDMKEAIFSDIDEELVVEDSQGNSHHIPLMLESDAKEAFQKLMQEAAAGRPDWRSFAHRWRPEEEVHETAIRPRQREDGQLQVIQL